MSAAGGSALHETLLEVRVLRPYPGWERAQGSVCSQALEVILMQPKSENHCYGDLGRALIGPGFNSDDLAYMFLKLVPIALVFRVI